MNRKKVRPRLKEGTDKDDWDESDIEGYHMTNHRSGRTKPIGYCRDHGLHDTKEEAMECWREYNLEEYYDDDNWQHEQKKRDECVVCGEWGRWLYFSAAYSWLPMIWCCEEHKGKEAMEEEFNPSPSQASFGSF